MDKVILTLLIVFCIVLAAFLAHNYVFSIYETSVRQSHEVISADGTTIVLVEAIPVNGLGFRAPFRKCPTRFNLEGGAALVDVVNLDSDAGQLLLRVKNIPGKVTVLVKPQFALFPTRIEIRIEENIT
jgi:hypothetical protein